MVENYATPVTIEDWLRSGSGVASTATARLFGGRGATANLRRPPRRLRISATCSSKRFVETAAPKAIALAGKLTTCSSRHRCLSGACPICGRALQRMCVDATRNLFDDHGGEMLAVNVVMRRGWIELGDLIDDDIFDETRCRLGSALQDVNVPAFGGFDISLNEHETEEFAPYRRRMRSFSFRPGR